MAPSWRPEPGRRSTSQRVWTWLAAALRALARPGNGRRRAPLDALMQLDDHELNDIGLSRGDLRAADLGVLPAAQALPDGEPAAARRCEAAADRCAKPRLHLCAARLPRSGLT